MCCNQASWMCQEERVLASHLSRLRRGLFPKSVVLRLAQARVASLPELPRARQRLPARGGASIAVGTQVLTVGFGRSGSVAMLVVWKTVVLCRRTATVRNTNAATTEGGDVKNERHLLVPAP